MVSTAQQAAITYACHPAVDPVLHMMGIAQPRGSIATGKAHPRSRAMSARRMPIGTVRWARPTSRGSLSPRTTGISLQSQAIRRASVALISCP